MDIALYIGAVIFALYVTVFLHEMTHFAVMIYFKLPVTEVQIGVFNVVPPIYVRGVPIRFGLAPLVGWVEPASEMPWNKHFWVSIMAPITDLIRAILCLIIYGLYKGVDGLSLSLDLLPRFAFQTTAQPQLNVLFPLFQSEPLWAGLILVLGVISLSAFAINLIPIPPVDFGDAIWVILNRLFNNKLTPLFPTIRRIGLFLVMNIYAFGGYLFLNSLY